MHFYENLNSIFEAKTRRLFGSREILHDIEKCKTRLVRDLHLKPGDQLFYFDGNSYLFFIYLFSCWSLDLVFVPLDSELQPEEANQLFDLVQPSASFKNGQIQTHPGRQQPFGGLLLFTSGTIGSPKGIFHSWTKVENKLETLSRHIPSQELQVTLCGLPTHFGHGLIGNSLLPLFQGNTLVICNPFSFDWISTLPELMNFCRVTFFSSIPFVWSLLKAANLEFGKHNLARVHIASAPLHEKQYDTARSLLGDSRIFNVYGMTEFLSWVCGKELISFSEGNVGSPWGVEVLLDSDEITIAASSLANYFLLSKHETLSLKENQVLKTGDLGKLNIDGELILTGRTKNQINRAGIKIQPEEIEGKINSHSSVTECYVFGQADPEMNERVCALVVVKSCQNAAELRKDIYSHLSRIITRYKLPDEIVFVDSLPKTTRGKVDQPKCKELYRAKTKRN